MSRCTIIIGPPGSGKTTLAKKIRGEADVVIDQDAIFAALTLGKVKHGALLPFVNRATKRLRDDALNEVQGCVIVITTKWGVVSALACRHPRVIVLAPSPQVCASRNNKRGGYLSSSIIADWWAKVGEYPITRDRVNFLTGGDTEQMQHVEIIS